jgi:Dolichyl-phosphate-mannose-protein mannosyltransferase
LLTLRYGFHPNFFLAHSFFTGQSHLLVLAGLAVGTEQFAMGLLFLGGVLAAAAGACLARRWMNRTWAWLVALLFLVTPVVFWQISIAGTPDLWLAFFATTGVLVVSRSIEMPRLAHAIVAGAFAGASAGTKYTGCFLAVGIALAYLWEAKSAAKSFVFALASLVAGVWPYARNLAWTGDPLFPFLVPHLYPERVNAFTLASFLNETGASGHHGFWQTAAFPLFAAIDHAYLGFWQFLGPVVLALAPLLILAVRNTPTWRTALCVWGVAAIGIGTSTGMMRFLLPALPIALAAVVAGAAQLKMKGWIRAHYLAAASLCGFLWFGGAGLVAYDRLALATAAGFTAGEDYLRDRGAGFEEDEFINRTLQGTKGEDTTLVFRRHVYYLRVAYRYADPSASWAIDPTRLQNTEQWQQLFRDQRVRWVVRSPDYPLEIAGPLAALEAQGKLVAIARTSVTGLVGMRLSDDRLMYDIVILEVKN